MPPRGLESPLEGAEPELPSPSSDRPPLTPSVVQVIRPTSGWVRLDWNELWAYRQVLYFLTWRDVKLRYKQTWLGVGWAVLQPLVTVLAFTVLFGRFAGFARKTEGVPYSVHVLAGLLPWMLFSSAVAAAGGSLIRNAGIITKIYFPRLLVPAAACGVFLVDFVVSLFLFAGLAAYLDQSLTWQALWLPLLVLGTLATAVGVGSLIAAATVTYRDLQHVVPFLLQFWMFVTPIVYPLALVPQELWLLMHLNPMTGFAEGFRAALIGTPVHLEGLWVSAAAAILFFVLGVMYFQAVERRLADLV